MFKFFLFFLGVVVLSETNGSLTSRNPSFSTDDIDEDLSYEDWRERENLKVPFAESEIRDIPQKHPVRDSLKRKKNLLDKNFIRFGRSGFFQYDRCCKRKDLVGFAPVWPTTAGPLEFTKRNKDNFIRFGRTSGSDSFMRFGRVYDSFMRLSKSDKNNFMRFGRPDKDNFMRFGRGEGSDHFIRFGKGGDGNFMRFGRGNDKFMRFGREMNSNSVQNDSPDPGRLLSASKREKFLRFGKNYKTHLNFMRYGKSARDDSFIRFGRGGKNGTNFLRFGRDDEDEEGDSESDEYSNDEPVSRRKRTTNSQDILHFPQSNYPSQTARVARNPEVVDDETNQNEKSDEVSKPKVSLVKSNRPSWESDSSKFSYFPPNSRRSALGTIAETYKEGNDGSAFIRFG